MHAFNRVLVLLGAVLSLGVASAQLSYKIAPSRSFDLTTRFLETIYCERPDAFYPFIRSLEQYQVRPKVTFSDPAFKSSVSIDGKSRPSRYANHNPIFTLIAKPFEAFQALEASFARTRLWKERGAALVWRTALANDVAVPTLEAMDLLAKEREAEFGRERKTCQSWIDAAGHRVCTGDEFWKLVGVQQMFLREPIKFESSNPQLHSFDRLLPSIRNDSLPLVVLYAAATDEAFPALFDFLHRLAQPAAGYPRIQFALRWKVNSAAPSSFSPGRYDIRAQLESASGSGSVEDLSARATAFIAEADNKIDALSRIASSLPLLSSKLASTSVPDSVSSIRDSVKETNSVTLNGVRISNADGISALDLVRAMRTDTTLLSYLAGMPRSDERLARSILLNASVVFEDPKQSSGGSIVPSLDRPLEFVNLVEAGKDVSPLVTRASFVEGVTDEESEIDPPALASIFVAADLESAHGLKQVEQVLKFLESATQVRVAFLHQSSEALDTAPGNPYSLPSLLYSLASSKRLAEVYPSELRAFLDLEIGPDGPKRAIDDMWTQDNPITPFLTGGLKEEDLEGFAKYQQNTKKFTARLGLGAGEPAVVINGRIVRIDEPTMSSTSLHNLLQYELRRRIRPVAKAALPALTPSLAEDRVMQAENFNLATSILASSGVLERQTLSKLPSTLPSIHVSNASVIPMFSLSAFLDPISPFARRVVPVLVELSRDPLFTLDLHLTPTSTVPSAEDLASLYGSAFATTLTFDEEDTLEELPRVVEFDTTTTTRSNETFDAGRVVEVSVRLEGETAEEAAGDRWRFDVVRGKHDVVLSKVQEESSSKRSRDEL